MKVKVEKLEEGFGIAIYGNENNSANVVSTQKVPHIADLTERLNELSEEIPSSQISLSQDSRDYIKQVTTLQKCFDRS